VPAGRRSFVGSAVESLRSMRRLDMQLGVVFGDEDAEHVHFRQSDEELESLRRVGLESGRELARGGHRPTLAAGEGELVDRRAPANSEVPLCQD